MTDQDSITVPFADLGRDHAPIAGELRSAFERVLGSSTFILGHEVERFERAFAAYCGTEYCVGVSSGTAALSIMLKAAGLAPGDEVILPAHTFIATALAVIQTGARPVCVDVEEGSGLIDPDAVAAAITEATAAILPVHLYGQVAQMGALRDLADRHGLLLLEDAAQAHGASYRGRRAGGLGDAAAFSFYPSKNLGALGDAGAICTDDSALADAARHLRDLGRWGDGRHDLIAFNDRLDGLQAAFLRVKLPHLDHWNDARRRIAQAYRNQLSNAATLLAEAPESPCIYHLFPVRTQNRNALASWLRDHGIATGIHYSPAVPDQPALKPLAESGLLRTEDCPATRRWADEELSLPMFASLREEEVEAVVAALSQCLTLYSGETSGVHHGLGSNTNHGRDQRDASDEQWWRSAPAVQDLSTVAGGGECE